MRLVVRQVARLVVRLVVRLVARWLAPWIGGAGLALGAGCLVHDTPSVNPGYGYGESTRGGYVADSVSVGEPSPYYVSSMPPEPLYEQMSASPGDSSVW